MLADPDARRTALRALKKEALVELRVNGASAAVRYMVIGLLRAPIDESSDTIAVVMYTSDLNSSSGVQEFIQGWGE